MKSWECWGAQDGLPHLSWATYPLSRVDVLGKDIAKIHNGREVGKPTLKQPAGPPYFPSMDRTAMITT